VVVSLFTKLGTYRAWTNFSSLPMTLTVNQADAFDQHQHLATAVRAYLAAHAKAILNQPQCGGAANAVRPDVPNYVRSGTLRRVLQGGCA
jgi:hypothetical protein